MRQRWAVPAVTLSVGTYWPLIVTNSVSRISS